MGTEEKNPDKMKKSAKRPSQLMEGKDSDRPLGTPLVKQSLQPCPQYMIYEYYLKLKHLQRNHLKVYELCFMCRFGDHLKNDCPFKRQRTLHQSDQHIQYHRWERIQDLLIEELHFISSNKHKIRHGGE